MSTFNRMLTAPKIRVCSVVNTDVADSVVVELSPCRSGGSQERLSVYKHRILYGTDLKSLL